MAVKTRNIDQLTKSEGQSNHRQTIYTTEICAKYPSGGCTLKCSGCAFGALEGPPIKMLQAQLDDFGGKPMATLIGGTSRITDLRSMSSSTTAIVQLERLRAGIWGTKSLWGRVLTYKG